MTKASRFVSLSALALCGIGQAVAGPRHLTEPALHDTAPSPAAGQAVWGKYTNSEGGFSVLLPSVSDSKTSTTAMQPAKGPAHHFLWQTGSGSYLIQYFDAPVIFNSLSVDQEFAISEKNFLKSAPGTILSRRSFVVNGHPCHEIVVRLVNGSTETHRLYVAGLRRYLVFAMQTPIQAKADPAGPTRFLSSFTILH